MKKLLIMVLCSMVIAFPSISNAAMASCSVLNCPGAPVAVSTVCSAAVPPTYFTETINGQKVNCSLYCHPSKTQCLPRSPVWSN